MSCYYGIIMLLLINMLVSQGLGFRGGIQRWSGFSRAMSRNKLSMSGTGSVEIGGKIVVTGVGALDEDEFLLNLLNEQDIWESIVLGTPDIAESRKRFLSRTARYSGLDNLLEHAPVDLSSKVGDDIAAALEGANTWIAVNCKQVDIPSMTECALKKGVKKVIFTLELPAARINETVIPEFDQAILDFKAADGSFTGIRHGQIIDGTEDNPYEIFNSSMPCLEETVERGVLARVATQLLLIGGSENAQCGLSSSSAFSQAYLNVLRSSGLTRTQEVTKIFEGGVQKMARMTVDKYENDKTEAKKREEEKAERKLKAKKEEEAEQAEIEAKLAANGQSSELAQTGRRTKITRVDGSASITPGWDEDDINEGVLSPDQQLEQRAEDILRSVYAEFEARLYAKSTSRTEFYERNRDMAMKLAKEEVAEEASKLVATEEEQQKKQIMLDRLMDVNRMQYSKLLALEKTEMEHQKSISDVWVKYIYLLLEKTMQKCEADDVLFFNLDQFGQTLLLRETANELRAACNLYPYDVIYDPLDAAVIVAHPKTSVPNVDLSADLDTLSAALQEKYGKTLKSVPALRGAAQIVDLAIDLLKKELPAAPLSVNDKRAGESREKQAAVSASRLEKITRRGKPVADEDSVGRM